MKRGKHKRKKEQWQEIEEESIGSFIGKDGRKVLTMNREKRKTR